MTEEERIRVEKEIENLMQFDKMFLIELILNLERNNLNLTKKINELSEGAEAKNGQKE